MPFLRVLRDKRGYETTQIVHWIRDGNRQRSRILYMFRTPPGVRVGRAALDPAVVREIEAQHPDVAFDWRALVDNRQVIDHSADVRRPRQSKIAGRGDGAEGSTRAAEGVADGRSAAAPAAPPDEVAPAAAAAPPRAPVPAALEGETRELQLAFLARWYDELRDRVPHRTQDPVRRQALLTLVERLNPAAWQSDEEIVAGLRSASEALDRLSRVLSKRRRRSRRGRSPEAAPPANDAG